MEYLGLIIGYLIIVLTPALGLWHKILPRVEQPAWAAFVPFYNYFAALRACNQPWYWVIFLLMPGIQFIMWAAINVTVIRKFGEFGVKETILGILFPFPVFWKIANNPEEYPIAEPTNWNVVKQVNYRTPSDHVALFFALPVLGHAIAIPFSLMGRKKDGKKSVLKEWGDAILFALIAASAIRTYVFEPYTIPTGSMEKTLMVGDYLFVEKITYGARVPMTPFSFPVVHNSFSPFFNMKSYVEIQKIPYTRVPGFRFVERNDVTVFNFPAGDIALNDPRMPYGLIGHTYEQILRDEAIWIARSEGVTVTQFEANIESYKKRAYKHFEDGKVYHKILDQGDADRGYTEVHGILHRPVDKRENYIKRAVGMPGDVIMIKNKELFVNNELAFQAEDMQYNYYLKDTANKSLSRDQLAYLEKNFKVLKADTHPNATTYEGYQYFPLNKSNASKARSVYGDILVNNIKDRGYYAKDLRRKWKTDPYPLSYLPIFPNDVNYDWTEDNFGPLTIPAKGVTVQLSADNIAIYRRVIDVYEGHDLEERADGIYIDGKLATSYTFAMDYYWLMGDNRNNSADSRFWGFVPEDHVVGRAAFIWMSVGAEGMFGGGVRWERIFTGIK